MQFKPYDDYFKPKPVLRNPERENEVIERLKTHIPENYIFDPSRVRPEEYEKILSFMARYKLWKKGEVSKPEKGLFICGVSGTGKTLIAAILASELEIGFYCMLDIDEMGARNREDVWDLPEISSRDSSIVIDDVGAESGLKSYGNEAITRSLWLRLYDDWAFRGKIAIVTANLTLNQTEQARNSPRSVLNVLGDRAESRFCEMFEIVRFDGTDYRKEKMGE